MKITRETIEKIEKEARSFFENASGCHDWSHVERVKNLGIQIGKKEKANIQIIEISALLHDIGRNKEMRSRGAFCHAEVGAKIAKNILEKYPINKEDKENILHCIVSHRYRNAHVPNTLEAKIIYDSDKLDSIGALGIGRTFLFAGSFGSNNMYTGNEKRLAKSGKDYSYTKEDSAALEYEIKLKYIEKKVLTKTGKEYAKERQLFMKNFFDQFWEEIKGVK